MSIKTRLKRLENQPGNTELTLVNHVVTMDDTGACDVYRIFRDAQGNEIRDDNLSCPLPKRHGEVSYNVKIVD